MDLLKKFLHTVIYPASFYYTVITILFSLISENEESYELAVLSSGGIVLIFVFAVLVACLNLIFKIKSMNIILRVLLHFIGFVASFAIIFLMVGGYNGSTGSALVILGIVSGVYVLIAAVSLIIYAVIKKVNTPKTEYKKQFGKG